MDISALQLAARFSYSPNKQGYCGLGSAEEAFMRCVQEGSCERVPEELSHFITLFPYLKTIAAVKNCSPYDYAVIEAYWIGNEHLRDFPIEGYALLLAAFEEQGVPSWLTQKVKQKVPTHFIPNHLFQVLHVGVGQASGSVPFTLESINHCMIRWGEVMHIDESSGAASIRTQSLVQNKHRYTLKDEDLTLQNDASPWHALRSGDHVALHWNRVAKILTEAEISQLRLWTEHILLQIEA